MKLFVILQKKKNTEFFLIIGKNFHFHNNFLIFFFFNLQSCSSEERWNNDSEIITGYKSYVWEFTLIWLVVKSALKLHSLNISTLLVTHFTGTCNNNNNDKTSIFLRLQDNNVYVTGCVNVTSDCTIDIISWSIRPTTKLILPLDFSSFFTLIYILSYLFRFDIIAQKIIKPKFFRLCTS